MKNVNIFSKVFIAVAGLVLMYGTAVAQLSGTYTIGGASPDYSTLSAAISALNSQGVNGAVVFNIRDGNYSGSNWRGSIGNINGASTTNTITFQSQSGNKANCVLSSSGSSSTNYCIRLNNAKYVTIKNLTLKNTNSSRGRVIEFAGSASNNTIENCVLTGHTGSSTSDRKARIYGDDLGSATGNAIKNNTIEYGSYGIYWRGDNSSSTSNDNSFTNNEIIQPYYSGAYFYYTGNTEFNNNSITRSGSGSSYFYGVAAYYTRDMFHMEGNDLDLSPKSYRTYGLYLYRLNYYSKNQGARPEILNNNIEMNTSSSVYYTYPMYTYYNYYTLYSGNDFDVNNTRTNGYIYMYTMYYNYYSKFENNTVELTKTDGTTRNYVAYRGTGDTVRNNTFTLNGNPNIYNYLTYYCSEYFVEGNEVNAQTSSNGTIYGTYVYYYDGILKNNKIFCKSDRGTIYGMYIYRQDPASMIYNNVVITETDGSNYTMRAYYNYGPKVFNNTFHSNSTGNNNYAGYVYHSSSSYDIELKNNIFSRSDDGGELFYTYRAAYMESDYNLYYTPGGDVFDSQYPNLTTSSLDEWRRETDDDMNSLVHDPGYNNAANNDVSIDPSSPNAWAVNGRGIHDTTISEDINGDPRPTVVTDGVPDLGAYRVVPTSTPPNATATPANPVANSTQVFTFGQDTVMSINWGATVPSTYTARQYTGVQAAPMPAGVGRMFFYVAGTPSSWTHSYTPHVYYKEPWIGDVSSEQNAVIARSSNGGAWEGYNYTNAATDVTNNILAPANPLDSVGSYTGVENGRIGIRCVENPKGIIISNITAFAADIEWDAVFNPVGYQVIVKTKKEMPTTGEWASSSAFPTTNSHAAIGLTEDTKYYVYIRTVCGPKDTSGVSIDSFITLITCHDPDVLISNLNNSRAVVSWDTVKTAYKYEFVVTEDANPPAFGTDLYKTSTLVPFLDENTQYYAHVRTHCTSIYSTSNWTTVPFTTKATGVEDVRAGNDIIDVYPNPASDNIYVTLKGVLQAEGTISIIDMTGKTLRTIIAADKNEFIINVSELPAGIYMLQYANAAQRVHLKFRKQ